jgi:methylmalonyl-CoA/ethylmalonyl-CoA epimerase
MSGSNGYLGVAEIGLAVEDIDSAVAKFQAVFGIEAAPIMDAPDAGIQMRWTYLTLGEQRINLMQDIGDGRGPIGRSVAKKGEGYFNSIIQVKDLDAVMERLEAAGVKLVEDEPRVWHDGEYAGRRFKSNRVIWTNPRTFHGMLVEFQEFVWADEQ